MGAKLKTFWILAIILTGITIAIGFFTEQSGFSRLFPLYTSFWLIYVYIASTTKEPSLIQKWIYLSLFLRFLLLFSFPNLSDDIYRFIWDGLLIKNGINPFEQLPSELIQQSLGINGINEALFNALNSPDYYTIYPPVAQLTFLISVLFTPNQWWVSAIIMKVFLLAFEWGNLILIQRILKHFEFAPSRILWYALNPLMIIEIVGNLHFEGAMLFFLLLSFWLLIKGKNDWAALAMALSITSKLLPLLFLPFLIRRMGWWKSIRFFSITGVVVLILFLPLINGVFIQNFGNSLDLYFRRFEFNGSIYYLARTIGYQIKGHNLISKIGPILALIVFLSISLKAFLERQPNWRNWPLSMLFAITIYLFLGTTIHPWYTCLPLALCLFHQFRYPVLWTGLVILTYINYSYENYHENLWMVLLEYVGVYGFLLYELLTKRSPSTKVEASN